MRLKVASFYDFFWNCLYSKNEAKFETKNKHFVIIPFLFSEGRFEKLRIVKYP